MSDGESKIMWQNFARTAAATALWSGVHSALASSSAKYAATRWLGPRSEAGLYRGFYNVQSTVTFAALVAYIRRQPDQEIYHARGPVAGLLRAGQAVGLLGMGWTALHIGPGRLSGLDGLLPLATGADVPPPAEGHGPTPDPEPSGHLPATGPFRHTRHPMNVFMPLVMWLNPRMTVNLLAFNLVGTAYFIVGSALEEARMLREKGSRYEDYRHRGIPFYLPRLSDPEADLHQERP